MGNFEIISVVIIFLGSAISFLLAAEQLTGQKFTRRTLFRVFHLIASGIFLTGIGLIPLKVQVFYPISGFLFTTSVFLAGPSNLLYHRTLLYPDDPGSYRYKKYLVIPILALIADIGFQLLPSHQKRDILKQLFENPSAHFFMLVFIIGGAYNIVYQSLLFKLQLSFLKDENIRKGVKIIFIQNVFAIACVAPLLMGFIMKNRTLYIGAALATVVPQFIIMLTQNRYAELFNLFAHEVKRIRYRKSRLRDIDLDSLHAGLNRLMEDEKIYREFNLTIQDTANKLFITPERLSQFLNQQYNLEFRNFINKYRIEEAKLLINSNLNQSIISICYQTGFGSKSSFYNSFKKFTGKTPIQFRKECMDRRK